MVMVSDLLIRKYESVARRILKASMIHPDIITRNQRYLVTLKALEMFREAGVEVELRLHEVAYSYIIPREAIEMARHIYDVLGLRATAVFHNNTRAYLNYVVDNIVPLYVRVECSIPEPSSILGGVESFYELRGYPADAVERYLEYIYENYNHAREYINSDMIEEGLNKIPLLVTKIRDALAVVGRDELIFKYTKERFYMPEELRLVGLGPVNFMVERLSPESPFIHYTLSTHGMEYILYGDEATEEILRRCIERMEKNRERERMATVMWRKLMERYSNHHIEIGVDELRDVLSSSGWGDAEKIAELAGRYCEKIYLVDKFYNGYHRSYIGDGISFRHPLRLLYLLRLCEEEGIQAHIVKRGVPEKSLPRLALRIDRDIYNWGDKYSYPRPLNIILVPKRDLEIDYPCEVMVEDGFIVAVDGRMLSRAFGGG